MNKASLCCLLRSPFFQEAQPHNIAELLKNYSSYVEDVEVQPCGVCSETGCRPFAFAVLIVHHLTAYQVLQVDVDTMDGRLVEDTCMQHHAAVTVAGLDGQMSDVTPLMGQMQIQVCSSRFKSRVSFIQNSFRPSAISWISGIACPHETSCGCRRGPRLFAVPLPLRLPYPRHEASALGRLAFQLMCVSGFWRHMPTSHHARLKFIAIHI